MMPRGPARPTRRSWREAPYAALDFETTGLDFRRDAVVSIGVIPVLGGRVVMREAIHQLVAPAVAPSPRSQTIHELRPQDLMDAPSLDEARPILAEAIEGRHLLVWFADVEVHFLAEIFGGSLRSWRRRTIDVRNLAIAAEGQPRERRLRPGFPLTGTAEQYGVPVAEPHQAFDDALVTAQLFLVLTSHLGRREPTVREVVRVGKP